MLDASMDRPLQELEWFMSLLALEAEPAARNFNGSSELYLNCADTHFARHCKVVDTPMEHLLQIQDLLRVLRLHNIAINILVAVCTDDATAQEMNRPLYDLLIAFCTKNPKNQVACQCPPPPTRGVGDSHEMRFHGPDIHVIRLGPTRCNLSKYSCALGGGGGWSLDAKPPVRGLSN